MRRSRDAAAATRRSIVDTASRLFRGRGIASVSVADIMATLGLTVGGFYRHFESKQALVGEAIEAASLETTSRHAETTGSSPRERAAALLDAYLSRFHRDHADVGCPVAALCSEVAHEDSRTRDCFTIALRRLLAVIAGVVPGDSKAARSRRLDTAASIVGALVLARATTDEALAADLLEAARQHALRE